MIGSSRRVRSDRGFALVAALLLAILFLSLMELTLRDTSESIRRAHTFRARLAAEILADNAAELAAAGMVGSSSNQVERELAGGRLAGSFDRGPEDSFTILGEGISTGTVSVTARVELRGTIVEGRVRILQSRSH